MESIMIGNYELREDGTWFSFNQNKILKPTLNSHGYERVGLYQGGERKKVFTHIKVVEYFGDKNGNKIPAGITSLSELGLSIDHIDRNKHNNARSNLELITHKENCRRWRDIEMPDDELPF